VSLGASFDDENGDLSGSAYQVFTRSGSTWQLVFGAQGTTSSIGDIYASHIKRLQFNLLWCYYCIGKEHAQLALRWCDWLVWERCCKVICIGAEYVDGEGNTSGSCDSNFLVVNFLLFAAN